MPTFMRNLWLSAPMMRGGDIAQAQSQLIKLGAKLSCDGIFGRATRDAVLDFQKRNAALTPDGILGRHTWAVLFNEPGSNFADRVVSDILDPTAKQALNGFHRYYAGSVQWKLDPSGIIVEGENGAVYSPDELHLVSKVLTDYGDALATVLSKVHVPIELVVACICTESSGKAAAERHEKGCSTVDPALTPARVSVGLMQTLLSTASSTLGRTVSLADLRRPIISIEAGATYMWRQGRATRFDPPLVASAYNAGSLRYNGSAENRWKLVQYPIGTSAHADRFVRFFNAAMNLPAMANKVTSLGGRVASLR
jgi:hypothetical protein